MRLMILLAAAVLFAGGPAAAQSYGYNTGYGHGRGGLDRAPTAFDWRSQLDRPGDYRCDAYWDAGRNDCGARWRDQRHRTSYACCNVGYGRDHGRYSYGYGYDRSRYGGYGGWRQRGYGSTWSGGYAVGQTAYYGAYGRPDLVSGGGYGGYGRDGWNGARDRGRIRWCQSRYRSYDPASGYYRAWSGRLIFCG